MERRPEAIHEIEQEVLTHFVKPIRIGSVGDAWIYSPDYVVFDESEDFPKQYQGKSMALIFALQRQHGATHYEAMTQAVMQGREGVGWYIWQPDKAMEWVPWWEPLTQDAGREIAAWSPVVVFPNTDRERIWVVGMSAMLPELMRRNGSYDQIQTSIGATGVMTIAVLGLMILLRRSRSALEASETHYRAIVEDQMEMICRFRRDGTLTFVNQAYAAAFGIQPHARKPPNVFDLISQSQLAALLAQLSTLSVADPVRVSERPSLVGGELRWQQWTDRAILNSRGQVVEIQSVGRDITNRKLYEAEIERLAFTDPLTGLANRRRLYDIGQATLQAATQLDQIALIYLDLDRFKPINDTLGHEAGDELLKQVAERLRLCIRKGDTLARLGGDEFAILLTQSELTEAQQVAERIVTALHLPFHLRGHEIQIGTSVGIATAHSIEIPFTQLLTQADIAMYRAKGKGRGNYVVFDAVMYAEVLTRRQLELDLQQAIEQRQMRVFYQPIVSLINQQIAGFEAVIRWQHPERGLLAPGDFWAVAEEVGVSSPIERWVLQQACEQISAWQAYRFRATPLMVSVNLSGRQLTQPDLVTYLEQLLQTSHLAPHCLMLEITEDTVIQRTELVIEALTRLRQLRVKIGLDDFGTGYSSLSYLHRFPVDVLKIDGTFIQSMHHDEKNSEIVRSIVTLANSLEIGTIAESVETFDQLLQLRSLHCSYGQGYFFAEPLSHLAAEAFLKSYSPVPFTKHG
jgi:diguanylate cyclase (GGDEF)-like protein/PAS domain S-box-containing protein